METYGKHGMLQSTVKNNFEIKKVILELASHVQLDKLPPFALNGIDWAKGYDNSGIDLKEKEKKSGRRSYLESDPKLVMKVRELRENRYKYREITDILFEMGWHTATGKKFNHSMIRRLYQQSDILVKRNSQKVGKI